MDTAISEIMNQMEELASKARLEMDRLTRELAKLENLREDLVTRLSDEGNNEHVRRQLIETDEKITILKKTRQDIQDMSTARIRELRTSAEKLRDQKVEKLKRRHEKISEERDALRDEIIPEAEQELREHLENKKKYDGQLLTITNEINTLNRLDIPTPNLG
jgi:chromosome segregation ATPase